MRKDKDQAITLRKAGKSYREIEGLLKVPRSTLSEWFKNEEWSKEIRTRLDEAAVVKNRARIIKLDKVRGEKLEAAYRQAKVEAAEEYSILRFHPLFLSGVMLYWGEGDKVSRHGVRMSNSDPALLKIFAQFLEHAGGIQRDDICVSLLVYPDLNEQTCREYWSHELGLGMEHFRKSVIIQGRHKSRRLNYGVGIVYTSSAYLKVKLLEWIRLYSTELMKKELYATI